MKDDSRVGAEALSNAVDCEVKQVIFQDIILC